MFNFFKTILWLLKDTGHPHKLRDLSWGIEFGGNVWEYCKKQSLAIWKVLRFATLDDVNLSVIRSSAHASKKFCKGIKIPEVLTFRLSSFPLPFFFFSFKWCSDFTSNSLSIASTFEGNVFLPTTVRQVGLPGTSNLVTSLASSANCRTQWQKGYTSWWYNGHLTFFFRIK